MSSDFWAQWLWPAATAVLGFVYVFLLLRQYAARRKMHQLMWAIGFAFYAIAALMEAVSEYTGYWNPMVYRFYIVLAASLVGFLGNGTLYLITKDKLWGNLYFAFNLVMLGIFLYGALTVPLLTDKLVPGIVVGGQALGKAGEYPRIMSLVFNIPGSLLLLGGSAWSVIKFWRKPEFRYRSYANILIIIGTLIIAGAGGMARAGETRGLYLAEMVASAILLAGFLMASTLEKGGQAAIEAGRARRAAEAGAGAEGKATAEDAADDRTA